MKFHTVGRECVAQLAQLGGAEAIGGRGARRSAEDLRKIDDRVARNCKSKLSLAFAGAFNTALDQSTSVENGGERCDPGLIVMLRAKVREHRVGKMAFH